MAEDEIKLRPLVVDISASTARLEKTLKRIEAQNRGAFSKIERDAKKGVANLEGALARAGKRMEGFGRSLLPTMGALATAVSAREVAKYADAWTAAGNKLNAASQIAGRAARSLESIRQIADRSRAGLAETADLYAKILRATPNIAKSELQVAKATEIVAKAFKAGGAAASEQAAGILQLSQALGSGLLQGDELRSIRENAPLLAQAIADEFKTTVAGLKDLGSEGKLTTDRVFAAILNAQPKIEAAFGATNATIADGMTRVHNALTQYIGQTDSSLGASARLTAGLNTLADNFDVTADFALQLASVIAGALVGRSLVSMIGKLTLGAQAVVAFSRAIASARTVGLASAMGGMSAAAGPLGMLIGGVLVGSLVAFSDKSAAATLGAKTYAAALKQVEHRAKEAAEAIDETSTAIDEQSKNALTSGVDTGIQKIEEARQAAADLFDQLFRNADMSAVSPEQITQLESIRDAFNNGTSSADQTRQALFALANSNPNFQAVAEAFDPVLRKLEQAIDATDVLKKQLSSLPSAANFHAIDEQSMAAYRQMRDDAQKFIAESERRAALTKDQLALEKEIASVRTDALKAGVALTERQIENIAKANLEADKRRSGEGKKDRLTEYQQLTKRIEEATAAQLYENNALANANPLVEDYGFQLAKARAEFDLINAAKEDGREITPELAAEIGKLASKYAEATAAGNHLSEVQDKIRAEAEAIAETMKGAFAEMTDALFSAGDMGQKLIGIFANVGRQFARMGANQLFDAVTGKAPLFGNLQHGGSVSSQTAVGREVGRIMAQPISDRFSAIGDDLASNIRAAADTLGISARDLATVISYETGGTFSTSIRGGKNNQHIGLIQFGAEEQRKYGAAIGQTLSDQMEAVVSYLKDRGLKPGMDLLDLYSTINAGRPGLYNRSDAAHGGMPGTVYDKVTGQMAGHQANADRVLRQGVSDGVVTGIRKVSNDPWITPGGTDLRTPTGGNNLGALLGVGGAALGAFAGGYESGSPLSGALGGAMAGLGATSSLSALGLGAAAGPVGIIGGAIIGLIGGLIGKSKKKKQELKQAQQELESQLGAISDLMATATGNFFGSFQKQFTSTIDELNKAIQMAEKAKNTTLANNLRGAMNTFFEDLTDKWNRGFEGMIASLNAGEGLDSAYMKGMGAVENMRESLIGFVNDARFFTEANGDLQKAIAIRDGLLGVNDNKKLNQYQASVWINKDQGYRENELIEGYFSLAKEVMARGVEAFSKTGGQLYQTLGELRDAAEAAGVKFDELGNILEDTASAQDVAARVREAQAAARATLYAQLSGAKVFTEIENAIASLEGKSEGMKGLLIDLGISAETAGQAIEHHLARGIKNLMVSLTTDLTRSINQLAGADYLNELIDAQTTYETRLRDLAAVGMDTSLAAQELTLRLRNIAKEAELTDDQLTALAKAFPQMDIALLGLRGMLDTSLSVDEAKAKLDEAKADLRSAYESEKSALEQVISKHEALIKSLRKFRDDLRLDDNLSPLDPFQRLQEAQKQFQETATAALGGDEEAMGRLEDVSRAYLEEARSYYATSEAYFSIFNEVESILDQALGVADKHLSEAQQQLDALKAQVSALIDINDSVMSVADAVAALALAEEANAAAIAGRDAQQAGLYQQVLALLQANGQAFDPAITGLYQDVLGRAPDKAGADFWTNALYSGISLAEIEALMRQSAEFANLKGFDTGGFTGFGNPSQIAGLVHAGEFVVKAAATTPNLSALNYLNQTGRLPSNDNGSLLQAVQAVRNELTGLRDDRNRGDSVVATGAQAQIQATERNTYAVNKQAEVMRQMQYQRRAG